MEITLTVKIPVLQNKLDSFKQKRQRIQQVMDTIDQIINTLAKVAWISPAARAFLAKYQILRLQILAALKVIDGYITFLDNSIQQYGNVETLVSGKVDALRSSGIFNT
jgi:uncharacterized protein YukE